MESPSAFFREAGLGPAVVCLHSSASSSGQWRGLMDRLAPTFRVIAVDLYGYGQSPAWSGRRPFSMDDELALLEPVFRSAGERFHLVGHSYGGAIALKAALAHTGRIASLAIFEPVLFSILLAGRPRAARRAGDYFGGRRHQRGGRRRGTRESRSAIRRLLDGRRRLGGDAGEAP